MLQGNGAVVASLRLDLYRSFATLGFSILINTRTTSADHASSSCSLGVLDSVAIEHDHAVSNLGRFRCFLRTCRRSLQRILAGLEARPVGLLLMIILLASLVVESVHIVLILEGSGFGALGAHALGNHISSEFACLPPFAGLVYRSILILFVSGIVETFELTASGVRRRASPLSRRASWLLGGVSGTGARPLLGGLHHSGSLHEPSHRLGVINYEIVDVIVVDDVRDRVALLRVTLSWGIGSSGRRTRVEGLSLFLPLFALGLGGDKIVTSLDQGLRFILRLHFLLRRIVVAQHQDLVLGLRF